MTEPTQQEKTLAIAKAMNPANSKDEAWLDGYMRNFNPYKYANDSQTVQEFFKIDSDYYPASDAWECGLVINQEKRQRLVIASYDQDLKTAIADCAYKVVTESKK